MKARKLSLSGKRVLHTRAKVKLLPLVLVAAMLSGMLLTSSIGAEGVPTDSNNNNQVTEKGTTLYYDSRGGVCDSSNYAVSVNKTVTQAVDSSSNPIENRFKVDLTVETTTNYTTIETTKDAAVVLVVDMSSSMVSQCAECGYYEKPIIQDPALPANAHCENGVTNPPYYCTSTQAGAGKLYSSDTPEGTCRNCYQSFAGAHGRQHVFVSRIKTAERDVKTFLEEYVKSTDDAKRELVVLTYSGGVERTVPWQNVAGLNDAGIAKLIGKIFKTNGTTTNTVEAMRQAKEALGDIPDGVPLNQASVILMTDGVPNNANNVGYSGGLQTEYDAAVQYCKDNKGKAFFEYCLSAYSSIASYGLQIRDLGAAMYTICFSSGQDSCYLAQYLMKFPNVGYDAGSATGLGDAFTDIIKKMTELRPNTVSDVLPSNFHYVENSFDGMGKNTATESDGAISWVLSKLNPGGRDQNGRYTYQLSYEMKLDNLSATYVNGVAAFACNEKAPTFSFMRYKTVDNVTAPDGPMRTVNFAIPKVRCYSGTVSFYKTDPKGVVITKTSTEASRFKLSVSGWSGEASNDGHGKVTFYNVPSGHTYSLTELVAPAGHQKNPNTYDVDLAWGAVANNHIPQGTIISADGKTTIANSDSRMVNAYLTMNKEITVQKNWIDTTEAYKDQTVAFNIYKSGDETTSLGTGTMTISNATTPGGKTWRTTVSVPGKDAQTGAELQYSIKETPIPGYTATYDGLNITNKAEPRTTTVTITKIWRVPVSGMPEQTAVEQQSDTEEPQVGDTASITSVATPPPAVITLQLGVDGTHTPFGEPYKLTADEATRKTVNGEYVYETTITISGVPVLAANNKEYTYRVVEDPMDGFHQVGTAMPDGKTFIVTNASDALLTTSVPFHKHWEGDEDHISARVPVTVALYADYKDGQGEKKVAEKELTSANELGTNENVWAGSFDNLPRYVDDDVTEAKIAYRFEEITLVPGYLTSYDGIDIVNTWNETSFKVTKNWVKPESAVTPPVTFNLYRSDNLQTPYRTYTMQPGESAYTFTKLPLLSDDKQTTYTYSVKEVVPTDYTSKQVGADFTNTINQRYDVTVTGSIEWDLRGQDESVKPGEVLVQLYAENKPCVYPGDYFDETLRGQPVTRIAKAADGWKYEFKNAQRYTDGLTADIAYSVRELGADKVPAPDVSTIQFTGTDTVTRSFGAHYREVTYDSALGTFTANIFNHTDAEMAAYRVDRIYNYTLDENTTVKNSPDTARYQQPGTDLTVNTGDYVQFDGKTYAFTSGMVSVTVDGSAEMFPVLKAGENTIPLEKTDRIYIVVLEYALSETTPPYVPDPEPPKKPDPTPTPSVTPSPSPSVTPTPTPTTPPPTTPPTETPPTTTGPTTPPSPDVRPTPPVLPPEVQDKVDEVIKDVTENPDHIIKDKDGFEERFPEISIEDLPPPLYWGPEFAIVEVPFYEEIVAIDSGLVPLGNLPQTGSDMQTVAVITALAGMAAIVLACTAALCGWLLRRKEQEAE